MQSEGSTVEAIVEGARFGGLIIKVIGLCFLLMICDSYDVSALSYAAPVLIKAWGIDPSAFGTLFSVGLFGLLVGSIAFGPIGDRIGRKRTMCYGALTFSMLTVATGFAGSHEQLLLLRFLAALGLGGAVPNAVALTTEFTPKRVRITAVGAIFAGYSIGGVLAGLTGALVVPALGWPAIFILGGGISLATTLAFSLLLPESLRYLAARPARREEAARVAAALRPDLASAPGALIAPNVARDEPAGRLSDLFAGRLRTMTPLLWLIYVANSMTVFSLTSWMPVAVESLGLSRSAAALATSLLFAGSAVGGVVGGRFADRYGLSAIVVMAAAALPTVASIGLLNEAPSLLFVVSFAAGCFAFGAQTCLHGVAGSLYPTRVRANGVGWAIGVAKVGSILGPFLGGLLLPRLTSQSLFLAAASPLLLVVLLAAVLGVRLARRPGDGTSSEAWGGAMRNPAE